MSKNAHVVPLHMYYKVLSVFAFDHRRCDRLNNIYHVHYSSINGSAQAERYRY